jgi:5'(3')-deoxyribonucleotidase
MKITELLESVQERKPIVYVDMDGVLADLYSHAAEISDVEHYNQMTPEQWETFFKDSNAYHLFRDIQPFATANQLLELVKKYAGGYTILSSPLNFDRAGSIKGKSEWLKKHIKVAPDRVVFEHEKYKYAVQPDGTPNILIDDYGVNTRAWDAAGGTAVKYQADEDDLSKVVSVLQKVFGKDK